MGIELLILGLDGVIVDTEEAHLWACNAAFKNCGLDLRWSMREYRKSAWISGATNAVAEIADKTSDHAPRLVGEKNRLFREFISGAETKRHPGCAQLIANAMDRGCKLAVVTDMPAQTASILLEQVFGDELNSTFAVILSGADFNAPPDNGAHSLIQRTVGIDSSRCVAIDASSPGLHAAQRAGIWTVAAATFEKDIAGISDADFRWPDLQEPNQLRGRRNLQAGGKDQFFTFDALNALKNRKHFAVPLLKASTQGHVSA